MLKQKRYKPKYKELINLREDLYNRTKVLRFKKKKWLKSVLFKKLKKKLYYDSLLKKKIKKKTIFFFRLFDHSIYYRSKANSFYSKRFKQNLLFKKKLCHLFGNFKIKTLKSIKLNVKKALNNKKNNVFLNKLEHYYLNFFERNLNNIVFKSHLSVSVRESQDFINKGYVFVNGKKELSHQYKVKEGDLITFSSCLHSTLIENFHKNLACSSVYFLPDYIEVNYKILQIIIFSDKIDKKYFNNYPFKLDFKKLSRFLI
jgi:ribosomal protein S4